MRVRRRDGIVMMIMGKRWNERCWVGTNEGHPSARVSRPPAMGTHLQLSFNDRHILAYAIDELSIQIQWTVAVLQLGDGVLFQAVQSSLYASA